LIETEREKLGLDLSDVIEEEISRIGKELKYFSESFGILSPLIEPIKVEP